MKRLLISLILGLVATMPLLGMEKPEAPAASTEAPQRNRVPALTITCSA